MGFYIVWNIFMKPNFCYGNEHRRIQGSVIIWYLFCNKVMNYNSWAVFLKTNKRFTWNSYQIPHSKIMKTNIFRWNLLTKVTSGDGNCNITILHTLTLPCIIKRNFDWSNISNMSRKYGWVIFIYAIGSWFLWRLKGKTGNILDRTPFENSPSLFIYMHMDHA